MCMYANDFEIISSPGASSSGAGSTSAPQSTYQPTMDYREVVDRLDTTTVPVFSIGEGPNAVRYYLEVTATDQDLEQVHDDAFDHANCNTCTDRAAQMATLEGPGGAVFMHGLGDEIKDAEEIFQTLRDHAVRICGRGNAKRMPYIVTRRTFPSAQEGKSSNGTQYYHWTTKPSAVTRPTRADLVQKAIDKYIQWHGVTGDPTMLVDLVGYLTESMAIRESTQLLRDCVAKIHRAGIYLGCLDWALGIQARAGGKLWDRMTPAEQMHLMLYAITSASKINLERGKAAITEFHQMNGAMRDMLERADKHEWGEKRMIEALQDLTRVDKYQHKDPDALKPGQLKVGSQLLGDFQNTVMTLNDLKHTRADRTVTWETEAKRQHSAAAGYAALGAQFHTSPTGGRRNRAGHRGRSNGSSFAARAKQRKGLTTVTELMEVLGDGSPHKLDLVDVPSHEPWVLAETTLDTAKLRDCQDHIWACWAGGSLDQRWGCHSGKTQVLGLYQMPLGQVFFLCKGAKPLMGTDMKHNLGNFNFPEFLSPGMHGARTVFEALNKTTSVAVPPIYDPQDHLAIGVCACPTKATKQLTRKMTIELDGRRHTLSSI